MKQTVLILITLILLFVVPARSEVFVDWKAGYYVNYPDEWYHVPYREVEVFLISQNVSWDEFDYDAVLAKKTDSAFFNGPYIFLSFLPSGKLKASQVDSILEVMSEEYGRSYAEGRITPETRFPLDRPVYDKGINGIGVKSRITSEFTDKILLELRRFYDKGIALFLCYAPKDQYNESRSVFLETFSSFSTDNLEAAAGKDSFVVVDPAEREKAETDDEFPAAGKNGDSEKDSTNSIYLAILAVIILGLVVAVYLKKKL